MKRPIIVLLAVCVCSLIVFFISPKKVVHSVFEDEREEFENEEEEESGADKQLESWFQARAYPDPTYLNEKYLKGWEHAQAMRRSQVASKNMKVASASWSSIGPNQTIGGRVLSIAIDPNNSNNIFIGTASGGIYKTTTAGTTCTWSYVPISNFPVVGVASIVYHPTNSSILLAGTGEVYRSGNSNIGFSVWKARGTYGIGILKSTDGGANWTRVYSKNTSDLWAVEMIKYDPTNANIVYAAATDGLYKSTDGGNNWSLLFSKIYVSDVAINPANNQQIVIAVGNLVDADKGIYRTTNGGGAWTKITSGLPASYTGYIRFDNVGSTRLYASIGGASTGNELCLSTDFGATWIAKASSSHCGGQYWFGHDLAVEPANSNHIFMGGVDYYNYTSTSSTASTGTKSAVSSTVEPHADVHDIKWDPAAGSTTVWVACDGGMWKSTDNGSSFSNKNSGLAAVQFYASIAPSPTSANIVIGGLQDNGVVKYNGTSWSTLVGGDGGPCAFHPNGTTVLMSNDARAVYISNSTGSSPSQKLLNCGYGFSTAYDDRTAFMSPVIIAPSNPAVMYAASDNLHISTNTGASFQRPDPGVDFTRPIEQQYKTAIALGISYQDYNKLYVSTSPFSQRADNALNVTGQPNVLVSLNASNNASYSFTSIKSNLPDRFVMDFAVSKGDDDSVFVVLGGFGTSHVYVTGNGGTSWTAVGTGLPDVPFNAILIDPVNPQVLYAAGDLGVYVSPNRGGVWYDYNNGLWDNTAMVMDIQANAANNLVIATHGKGVFVGPRYSGALPVNIVSFTGEALPASNKLTWKVAEEFNVARYEVQRSTNGTDFKTIGAVNATNAGAYSYSDPLSANLSYYYRLMSVDFDRSYDYSGVIYLKRESNESVKVLGNPFSNSLQIRFALPSAGKAQIHLYDAQGKLLRRELANLTSGQSVYTLDNLTMLPSGTYYVEAIVNNRGWKEKVIKK